MIALVIVDMQTEFSAAGDARTQRNVIREVLKAKKKKRPIVVLEYDEEGKTFLNIRKAIGDYDRAFTFIKTEDDGSGVVIPFLKGYTYNKQLSGIKLRVCGVNLGACVYQTVKGLLKSKIVDQVKVVWDACNGTCQTPKGDFTRLKNCVVVGARKGD